MQIKIRKYRDADRKVLVECIVKLQTHIAALDPMHRIRPFRLPDAKRYVRNLLKKVRDNEGAIYFAESQGKVIGLVAGEVIQKSPAELLESYPRKDARVCDLFVDEEYRDKNIGSKLVAKVESYFRGKKCVAIGLDCFCPNKDAHRFYLKRGYVERSWWLLKKL